MASIFVQQRRLEQVQTAQRYIQAVPHAFAQFTQQLREMLEIKTEWDADPTVDQADRDMINAYFTSAATIAATLLPLIQQGQSVTPVIESEVENG